MYYKGFRITATVEVIERQDVDENGDTTDYLDSWVSGNMVYEAKKGDTEFLSDSFDDIKRLVDLAMGEV